MRAVCSCRDGHGDFRLGDGQAVCCEADSILG